MPYFLKMEPTSQNNCGMFKKGYGIHCRGKVVVVEWGAVFVRKGSSRKVCWAGPGLPRIEEYSFPSLLTAREEYRVLVHKRLRWRKYKRLEKGRILKFRQQLLER